MKLPKIQSSFVFYLVLCYIFAAFAWWALLLNKKTEREFELKIELAKTQFVSSSPNQDFSQSEEYLALEKDRDLQRWMILGEGSVFLLLLLFGAWKIKSTFQKELSLARQKNNFLLSITHELKSPLAGIRLGLETLLKRLTVEEKFQRIMRNSLQDVDRLSNLVDNILLAARMENNSYPFQWEVLNVSEIAEKATNFISDRMGDKGNFETNIEENIYSKADRMALNAVLINLLENAVKYSPEGSPVVLKLYSEQKNLAIEIIDKGQGIPESEKEEVFKKFYRIGNEETRKTKGTGLGLYIVKNIVDEMGGKVEVMDNTNGGTVFRVKLQKAEKNG